MTPMPIGMDRRRHRDLIGRERHPWGRRAAITIFCAVSVLGLLNVFGQHATSQQTNGAGASLVVDSPAHLRGGLIFTTEIVIKARRRLSDAKLLLGSGWFEGMTFNGLAPQPTTQSASRRWVIFGYGPMAAGQTLQVWISWQVNPTNVGRHQNDVMLLDGTVPIVRVNRSITVFP